jgi:hypothetical protein
MVGKTVSNVFEYMMILGYNYDLMKTDDCIRLNRDVNSIRRTSLKLDEMESIALKALWKSYLQDIENLNKRGFTNQDDEDTEDTGIFSDSDLE